MTWLEDVENDLRQLKVNRSRQKQITEKNGNLFQNEGKAPVGPYNRGVSVIVFAICW